MPELTTTQKVQDALDRGRAQAGKNPWRPNRPTDIGLKYENLANPVWQGQAQAAQKAGNWWWTNAAKTNFSYYSKTQDGAWTIHQDTIEPEYGPSWQDWAKGQSSSYIGGIVDANKAKRDADAAAAVDTEVPDPEGTPSDLGVVGDPQGVTPTDRTYLTEEQWNKLRGDQAKIRYREIPEGFVRPGAGGGPTGDDGSTEATLETGVVTAPSPAEQSALDWAAGLDTTNAPGGVRSPAEQSALDWAAGLDTTNAPGGGSTLLPPRFDIGVGGYPGGIQRNPPTGGRPVGLPPVLGWGGYPGGIQRNPPTGGQVVRTGLPVFRGAGGYPGGMQRTPPTGGQVTGLRSAAALGGGYPGGILRGPPYQGRAVQLSQAIGGGGYPGGMLRNPPYQGQPVGLPTAADMPYTVQQALNNAISRDPYGIRAAMSAGPTVPWGASGGGYPGQNPWQQSGGRPVGVNQYAALNTPYTVQGALNNAYSRDPYGIRAAWTGQQAGGPVRGYGTPQFSPSGPQWQW